MSNNIYSKKPDKSKLSSLLDLKSEDLQLLEKVEDSFRKTSKKYTFLSIFMKKSYTGEDVFNLPLFSITIGSIIAVIAFFIIAIGSTYKNNSKLANLDNLPENNKPFILKDIEAKFNSSASDQNYNPNNYYNKYKDSLSISKNPSNISSDNIKSSPIIISSQSNSKRNTPDKNIIINKPNPNSNTIFYEAVPVFAEYQAASTEKSSPLFIFNPKPGQKIKVQLEYTKSTALNTPVIAYPFQDNTIPKDSKLFGQVSGEYDESIVIIFNKLFIPPDQVIDIKAIATDETNTSIKGEYKGNVDVSKSVNQGIQSSVLNILPATSDFLGSLLSSAGSSVLNSLDTNIDTKKVFEIPKGTILSIVFLP